MSSEARGAADRRRELVSRMLRRAGHRGRPGRGFPTGRPGRSTRSRSRRSASGSSTSSSPAARATTCPSRCACTAPLDASALAAAPRRDRPPARGRCARRFADGRRRAGPGRPSPAGPLALPIARPRASCAGDEREAEVAPARDRGGPRALRPRAAARCSARARSASRPTSTSCSSRMHHIVSDGWSMGVLVARARARSTAPSPRGRPSPLPDAADPVRRLRRLAARVAAGRRARRGSSPTGGAASPARRALELPTDRPRPPVQTFAARGSVCAPAAARSPSGSRELGRREGATLFMTLLAAFAVAARAATPARTTSCVGTPIANRDARRDRGRSSASSSTRSCCAPTSSGDPTLPRAARGGCARRRSAPTRTRTCRSRSSSRSCSPSATSSRNAALPGDVRAAERPAPGAHSSAPDSSAVPLGRSTPATAKFDLDALRWRETPEGLGGSRSSTTPISSTRATIERMAGHLRTLLEGVGRGTRTRAVAALPLLDEAGAPAAARRVERHRRRRPGGPLRSHELFEAQAARTPGRGRGRRSRTEPLTYRELDARANRSRATCARLGVGPETLVGDLLRALARSMVVGAARRAQGRRRVRAARPGATRASGWPSCSRTPARGARDSRRRLVASLPRLAARETRRSTRTGPLVEGRRRRTRASARRRDRQPRVRHLHLGLDRPPKGVHGHRTARSSTACTGCSASLRTGRATTRARCTTLVRLRRLGLASSSCR